MKCCICNRIIDSRFANNARPYMNGECCDSCNRAYVIPHRIKQMKSLDLDEMEWKTVEMKNE